MNGVRGQHLVISDRKRDRVGCVERLLVIVWLTLAGLAGISFNANADPVLPEPAGRFSWLDWNGDNFFGPCRGDCSVALHGGKEVTSSMERIFFVKFPPTPIWDWRWRDTYLVAGTFSRRLVTFFNLVSIEPEIGVAKRFGQMQATEFWAALNLRWIWFPWNNYIKTSIGLADGMSFTTKIDPKERLLSDYRIEGNRLVFTSSQWQNFFTPELALALPRYPEHELLFRFHHRSGIYGFIHDTFSGAQFFTVGYRTRF